MTHLMVVEARYYEDVSDMLLQGACQALEQAGVTYDVLKVPGALEIPQAIKAGILYSIGADKGSSGGDSDDNKGMGTKARFDAFVALGCVIRGETAHYDIVSNESARGLMDLSLSHGVFIGNGILTCENHQQALVRADPKLKDKGGDAVRAALSLLELQNKLKP